jgi:iron complex outermembrane recepter protein
MRLSHILLSAALLSVPASAFAQETPPPAPPTPPPPAAETPPAATTTPPAAAQPAPAPAGETPAPAQPTPPPTTGEQPAPQGQAPAAAPEQAPAAAEQTPADPDAQKLPEVEVIQKQAQPEPDVIDEPAPKKKPAKKKQVQSSPPPKPKVQPKPQPAQQQQAPEPAPAEEALVAEPVADVETVGPPSSETAVKLSPVGGSEVPLKKVPGSVGRASAAEISKEGSGQVQNVLNQQVPGVILSDTAGSSFRTDVQYRGFDASPIGGRSQALAVYQNGIRINEAFGDTVNLDLIPAIAINDITVLGSTPVYGLNAIGGAIGITMKDGFTFQGATIDALGGSFGRRQIAAEAGGQANNASAYVAIEALEENGFRDFSEAEIRRLYGDIGFKGSAVEVHLSFNGAKSSAGVVTAAPVELLEVGYGRTFTSPQVTDLEVMMPSISGKVQATETLTFSGLAYYRKFKSNIIDGNLSEADECEGPAGPENPGPGFLCLTEFEDGASEEEGVQDANGNFVPVHAGDALGSIERINTDAESYGGSVQAVEKSQLFGRPNQFLVGFSYDHGRVKYQTSSEIGVIGDRFVVDGTGIIVTEPEDLEPRDLITENDYYGVYFTNTLDITDQFALTLGGRYNHATIQLTDLTGNFDELNVTNTYERFNPMVGATYEFLPGTTLYGSYSEANRAPTAAELGCAEPENPCLIESFLTDDPPLKQVISRSFEVGLRGEAKSHDSQRFTWSIGYFRTLNQDDILNAAAEQSGRGFFLNAGDTQRQGVELAAGYQNKMFSIYGSYAFIDATFKDNLALPAPNTPLGTADCPDLEAGEFDPDEPPQCNFVRDGDNLPGIPRHRIKAGFEYWLTPKWKVGTDLIYASDQFFFGDEANNNAKLPAYTRVDLNTSYAVTDNVQIYGLIKNLFDKRYGLYGTFFDTEEAGEVSEAAGLGDDFFEDPRSITPAQPFAIYGGVRVQF